MTIKDALIYASDIGINNRTRFESEVQEAPSSTLLGERLSAADRFLMNLAFNLDFDIDTLTNDQASELFRRAIYLTPWKHAMVSHIKDKADLRSYPNLARIETFHEDVGIQLSEKIAYEITLQLNKKRDYFFWKRIRS